MIEITMPRLTDSMEEGTIVRWLKQDGEIDVGEELVEIETDKATITYPSEVAGTVKLVAREGETLAVGAVMARVGAEEEAAPAPPDEPQPASPQPVTDGARAAGAAATPLARRVAAAHGIELTRVAGTGPRGRITRGDVHAALGLAPPASAPTPTPAARAGRAAPVIVDGAGEPRYEDLTGLQKVVARRMSEAKATVPEFQVQTETQMDGALALREHLRERLGPDAVVPSLNDMIVKAAALALGLHPRVNASYADGRIAIYPEVNVGIAVAAEDALVVPVLRAVDEKSLGAIATETRALAERVRTRGVTPHDLAGATFTVSNLGMFGATAITPIVNPPQAAILGVGAVREVVARGDGQRLIDRKLATMSLTCDHRVLYGADAARFLATLRQLLEEPLRLML